ncbi:DUF192 domain-containing protein [Candidatus Peregrinibacteria bacterium]|nr:DUF192 domain-containing protein [Candidatus Peregrinibacteria bacterium]
MTKPAVRFLNFVKKIILILAVFLLFSGCSTNRQVIFHTQNGDYKISVEIADTDAAIQKGLMGREKLESDKGMLFIFKEDALRAFWMKNVLIPLDIIFISADKRVINIVENAPLCKKDPCENYLSKEPAKYVIEIAGGGSAAHGIQSGDAVEINP